MEVPNASGPLSTGRGVMPKLGWSDRAWASEPKVRTQRHQEDGEARDVGSNDYRVPQVDAVDRPYADPQDELYQGNRTDVLDRASTPHLDDLRNEGKSREEGSEAAQQEPKDLVRHKISMK